MTISATVTVKQYNGTGANTSLSTVFSFFVDADVVVTQRIVSTGIDTTMVLGTHYNMTGGSSLGAVGTVTPIDGATDFTTLMTWTLERAVPFTQDLDYIENDDFPAVSHEAGLDRLTTHNQDLDSVVGRSLRFPASDVTSLTSQIPDSVARASKALTFDSAGNVVVTDPASASGTTITATGSTTARTLAERWAQEINVKDYGAVGDGVTNDTTAFNDAFAALRLAVSSFSGIGTIFKAVLRIPPGAYRCDSPIDATEINGSGWVVEAGGSVISGHHVSSGKAVLDLYGSRFGSFYGLSIFGDATDVPDWGIQMGRSDATSSDVFRFYSLSIVGTFSKGCLYNYASESNSFFASQMWNVHNDSSSYVMVNDGTNDFGVTSDFTTERSAGTAASFNGNTYWNCDFRKMVGGPVLYMKRTLGHSYYKSYAATEDDVAIVIDSDSAGHKNLYLDVHCEVSGSPGIQKSIEFKGLATQTIKNLTFIDHSSHADVTVFFAAAGMTLITIFNLKVEIAGFLVTPSQNLFNDRTKFKISGGNIYIQDGAVFKDADDSNLILTTDDRDIARYGSGTKFIFDDANQNLAVKGEIRFYDQAVTNVLAGDLGNTGETRVNGLGVIYKDGVTAPGTISGMASTYVDTADGLMKVKFADGAVHVISTAQSIRTVASASGIAVTSIDQILSITGSTKIDDFTGGTAGQKLFVLWAAAATFDVDGTGLGIELSAGADITAATADSTLTLINDGTNWLEVGRSVT